mmetsp:Transcript_9527/g.23257  ORF Transcript_9527/g.23257 Transcript_9527/m.23257 type:complete len:369 (-) Transcript_9527:404-1510(-)
MNTRPATRLARSTPPEYMSDIWYAERRSSKRLPSSVAILSPSNLECIFLAVSRALHTALRAFSVPFPWNPQLARSVCISPSSLATSFRSSARARASNLVCFITSAASAFCRAACTIRACFARAVAAALAAPAAATRRAAGTTGAAAPSAAMAATTATGVGASTTGVSWRPCAATSFFSASATCRSSTATSASSREIAAVSGFEKGEMPPFFSACTGFATAAFATTATAIFGAFATAALGAAGAMDALNAAAAEAFAAVEAAYLASAALLPPSSATIEPLFITSCARSFCRTLASCASLAVERPRDSETAAFTCVSTLCTLRAATRRQVVSRLTSADPGSRLLTNPGSLTAGHSTKRAARMVWARRLED